MRVLAREQSKATRVKGKYSKIELAIEQAQSQARTNPRLAMELAEQAFSEATKVHFTKGLADSLKLIAQLQAQYDLSLAKDSALHAVEIYDRLGDYFSSSNLLMIVAKYFQHAGWTNRAHFVLQDAYDRASKSENHTVLAAALFNLGTNAEERKDLEAALNYFHDARNIAEAGNIEHVYWRALSAEQEMHYALRDGLFDLKQVQKAVQGLSSPGREDSLIGLFTFLANVSADNGSQSSARNYLKQAYRLARSIRDDEARAEVLYAFGQRKLKSQKFHSAIKLFQAALSVAQAMGSRTLELNCIKHLAEARFAYGESELAYQHLATYLKLTEELYRSETERHFEEMRTSQQVNKVEEESRQLKKRNSELGLLNERLETALIETKKLQSELQRMVTVDELTGALNRREILHKGAEFINRYHSQGRPCAVLIVDIDHFKSINDDFGHATGDEVLRRFTKSCQRVLRPTDYFGRLGGEEFCILLDRTSLEIALKVAERVMAGIRSTRVDDLMGSRIVTASMGLVEVSASHDTIESALNQADLGLYEAKRSGRDKICVFGVKKKKAA